MGRGRKQRRALAKREGLLPAATPRAEPLTVQQVGSAPVQNVRDNRPPSRPTTRVTAEYYSGVLPHPDHLERFDQIVPGAAARILAQAESQTAHRHAMERKFLNINGTAQILGVVFGGLFLLGGLAIGGFLVHEGRTIAGFATMVGSLATLAVTFLKQRSGLEAERVAKPEKRVAPNRRAGISR